MTRTTTLEGLITAGLLGLGAILGANPEHSSEDGPPACRDAWVTTYVTREVPSTRVVTRYEHCGRPYRAEPTCDETVRVAVRKKVLVCE